MLGTGDRRICEMEYKRKIVHDGMVPMMEGGDWNGEVE